MPKELNIRVFLKEFLECSKAWIFRRIFKMLQELNECGFLGRIFLMPKWLKNRGFLMDFFGVQLDMRGFLRDFLEFPRSSIRVDFKDIFLFI